MNIDIVFDIHQLPLSGEIVPALCESRQFELQSPSQAVGFSAFLNEMSSGFMARDFRPRHELAFQLVDMGTHRARAGNDHGSEVFYTALEQFAEFLQKTDLRDSIVTLCGKNSAETLPHELRLFSYFFQSRLRVSLSSAFWRPRLAHTVEWLSSEGVGIQVMLDVESASSGLVVRTPNGSIVLDSALDRFEALRAFAQVPLHLHVCSIRRAGMIGVDPDVLSRIGSREWGSQFGDVIYSGGAALEPELLVQIGASYPAVSRIGVNNDLLRRRSSESVRALMHATTDTFVLG